MAGFIPLRAAFFGGIGFTPEPSDLADRSLPWRAQAFGALFASPAVTPGAAVFGGEEADCRAAQREPWGHAGLSARNIAKSPPQW